MCNSRCRSFSHSTAASPRWEKHGYARCDTLTLQRHDSSTFQLLLREHGCCNNYYTSGACCRISKLARCKCTHAMILKSMHTSMATTFPSSSCREHGAHDRPERTLLEEIRPPMFPTFVLPGIRARCVRGAINSGGTEYAANGSEKSYTHTSHNNERRRLSYRTPRHAHTRDE